MQVHKTYLDDARDGRCYVIEDAEKKRAPRPACFSIGILHFLKFIEYFSYNIIIRFKMMNGLCSLSIENHKVTDHLSAFLSYLIERDPLTGYILLLR